MAIPLCPDPEWVQQSMMDTFTLDVADTTVSEEKAVIDRADAIISDLATGKLRGSKRDEVGQAVDRSKMDEAARRAITPR